MGKDEERVVVKTTVKVKETKRLSGCPVLLDYLLWRGRRFSPNLLVRLSLAFLLLQRFFK